MKAATDTQSWNADDYAANGRFVADLGAPVLALLDPKPGERILDLGCGDGALTKCLVDAGADVLGVDGSGEMIAASKALGLNAEVMDGQAMTFDNDFDAVFSNAALHWMPDADAVIDGAHRALKPGGRFVAEFGGFGNIAAIRTAVRAAYSAEMGRPMPDDEKFFPTDTHYAGRLEARGLKVTECALIPRPTPLPTGIRGWLATFGGRFFHGLSPEKREAVISATETLLAHELQDEVGNWTADYVRLRFRATKPDHS